MPIVTYYSVYYSKEGGFMQPFFPVFQCVGSCRNIFVYILGKMCYTMLRSVRQADLST